MTWISSMSDYLEHEILDHWLDGNSYTSPSKVYLALGTNAAVDSDENSWSYEISGNGYQRQEITFRKPVSLANGITYCANEAVIEFESTGSWGTVGYFTVWDAQTNGKLLFRGQLKDPVSITGSGQKVTVEKDELRVHLISHNYSAYLQEKLLDHILRNNGYTPPPIYMALTYTVAAFDHSGSDLSEPDSDTGYNRVAHGDWPVTSGVGENNGTIAWPTATEDYGDRTRGLAFCDSSGRQTGNLLAFTSLGPVEIPTGSEPPGPQLVLDGDTPKISDAFISVTNH